MKRAIIVTAGTSGIGKSIAEKMSGTLTDESLIIVYGHDDDKAEKLKKSIKSQKSVDVMLCKYDLTDYESAMRFCDEITADYVVNKLILNMGIGLYKPFEEYDLESWNQVMSTNLTIPAFMIKKLLDNLTTGGSVLLVSSYAGNQPYSSSIVYGVSKAGVSFLAKSLVKVLEKKKVRINAIEPGFVETAWHNNRSDESRKRIENKVAVHRFATPEEIADMAVSILNNAYMNGAVVPIHGGYDYF
ncbi:SDR family NAD(P)-dependent oxidoreductase [Butyrivibrio sp. INlla14]|uniref:SDR family NAD(P)-dependent oxidoreductase n=1 Tax=Butyrivibrio sp. INlla14 TaxID=1520808 RepID=UPI00087725D0|nr:SDR family oxidoreductase [Butyrivibrio sp. INlla14]SCY74432.1 3-oxoacyl-[acyl-carrier protein] reductase [Butyrivibrio sp. INlla14]